MSLSASFTSRSRHPRAPGWEPVFAGIFLSIAIQFKLYGLIALPLLAFRRWIIGLLLHFALATLVLDGLWLTAFHGPAFAYSENASWFASLTASTKDLLADGYNVSILGVLTRWSGGILAYTVWLMAALYALATLNQMRDTDPVFAAIFALGCVPLLNPLAWPYWNLLLFPAVLHFALPFAVGPRRAHPLSADPALGFSLGVFLVSLQQNQPFADKGALTLVCAWCLYEYLAWWRRQVIG